MTDKLPPLKLDLAAILAKARAQKAAEPSLQIHTHKEQVPPAEILQLSPMKLHGIGRTGEAIEFNEEQASAIRLAKSGCNMVLIGAAGTGKTTTMNGVISEIQDSCGVLNAGNHKYLESGTPGIVCIAYTRRAVQNLKRAMPENMKSNCITYHKLMEYAPEFYEVEDPESHEIRKSMRFIAMRSRYNPLPSTIRTIIVDESSMFSKEFNDELLEACPHKPQIIYLGDIQQLPPVFGSAVLGYKMLEYPVVELKQVYRQALESPIIRLAHRILSGNPIPASEFSEWKFPGKLTLHPWKKKLSADLALMTAAKFFTSAAAQGPSIYDPMCDQILIPYNKAFGTEELNKHIANWIARSQNRVVWEVVAGFNKHYFSVGDKVLVEKEDATIVSIKRNPTYLGAAAQKESPDLDYWGTLQSTGTEHHIEETTGETDEDIDFLLSQAAISSRDEDRVTIASHIITCRFDGSGEEVSIDGASQVNAMLLGYALTVHKSQGSEWRKVFFVMHQSHATMCQRELLYTACTRAKEELYVICEPETFVKGIKNQRIKGNTLEEKAEFFKGKIQKELKDWRNSQ